MIDHACSSCAWALRRLSDAALSTQQLASDDSKSTTQLDSLDSVLETLLRLTKCSWGLKLPPKLFGFHDRMQGREKSWWNFILQLCKGQFVCQVWVGRVKADPKMISTQDWVCLLQNLRDEKEAGMLDLCLRLFDAQSVRKVKPNSHQYQFVFPSFTFSVSGPVTHMSWEHCYSEYSTISCIHDICLFWAQ